MLGEWYSNCYIIPELTNKYNPWQVGSVLVSLMVYHKSTGGRSLMYMQHRHMGCGESHICHGLVLDQKVNDNDYSTPLLHEALDVDHQMVILGIFLSLYIFTYLCATSALSWTLYSMSVHFLLLDLFIYFNWSMTPYFWCSLDICFWDYLSMLT